MLAVIAALAAGGLSAPGPPDPEMISRTYDLRPLVERHEDLPAHTHAWTQMEVVFGSSFTFDRSGIRPCNCPEDAASGLDLKGIQYFIDLIGMGARGLGTAIPQQSLAADGGLLTLEHTAETHARVSAFREAFLAARGRPILVDVAIVPAEAVVDLQCGKPLPAGAFDGAAARAADRGRSFSLRAMNGQTVSDFAGQRRLEVIDAEINQTGVIPVSNPVVGAAFLGSTVEVQPLWTGAAELVRLKLDVSQAAEAGPIERRETFFTDIDLAPYRKDLLRTTVLIPAGASVVAGVLEEDADDGKPRSFAVLARVRAGSAAVPLSPEARGDLGVLVRDIAFITESPAGEEPLLSSEALKELIGEQVDPAVRDDDRLALEVIGGRYFCALAPPEVLAALGRWLEARAARRARQAILTLEEYEGSPSDVLALRKAVTSGAPVPEAASKLRRTLKVVACAEAGSRISAGGFVERNILADAEYVSGGTGFSILAIADPVMMAVRSGFEMEAVVTDAGKDVLRLDLDSRHRRTDLEGQIPVVAPSSTGILGIPPNGPYSTGARDPGPLWFGMPYRFDQPREISFGGRGSMSIPRSRPVVVRVERAPGAPARLLLAGVAWAESFERRD
jgi:hypothetical protein